MHYSPSQLILDSLRAPVESYLLTDAAQVYASERVLDTGCGSGIVALTLAMKYPQIKQVVGIELVRDHLSIAQLKYSELSQQKNGLARCEWVNGDVRNYPFQTRTFDVIVSNPPFYPAHHGKHSPNHAKSIAHMDGSLTLDELLFCVNQLLKADGRFYVVYPLARLDEILRCCQMNGFIIVKQEDHLQVRKRSGGITIVAIQRESESG
jgi:tRNA1Val (adenine37-N6)-methyltransferase